MLKKLPQTILLTISHQGLCHMSMMMKSKELIKDLMLSMFEFRKICKEDKHMILWNWWLLRWDKYDFEEKKWKNSKKILKNSKRIILFKLSLNQFYKNKFKEQKRTKLSFFRLFKNTRRNWSEIWLELSKSQLFQSSSKCSII